MGCCAQLLKYLPHKKIDFGTPKMENAFLIFDFFVFS
jgi:hypothetical protein